MPLIYQNWALAACEPARISQYYVSLTRVVQSKYGPGPLQRGRSLSHRSGPLDCNRRQTCQQLIEFVIDDPSQIWQWALRVCFEEESGLLYRRTAFYITI